MKDLYHDLKAVKTLLSIVGNNDTEGTGTAVDLQGYEGALVVFNIGASGDTLGGSTYITLKLQESDDGTTFADVSASEVLGTQGLVIDASDEDEVVVAMGYMGSKRYIRVFVDFTGTHTNGIPIGAVVILGKPRHAPISY